MPGGEVVDHPDPVALVQEGLDQVRADEPGPPRHQRPSSQDCLIEEIRSYRRIRPRRLRIRTARRGNRRVTSTWSRLPSLAQPSSWAASLSCWPAPAVDGEERAGEVGQGGQVAPELLELGDGEDVLLAVAPAPLHVLDRDVGRHPRGHARGRPRRPSRGRASRSARVRPKASEQAVDVDPGRQRVVVAERELGVLAGLGQPFEQPEPAADPGQAAAAVVDPPGDHLEAQASRRTPIARPSTPGSRSRPEGVDVVDHQPAQVRDARRAAGRGRRCGAGWGPRRSARAG